MVLRVTAARQALWTLLPRCQTEFLRSILSINSGHIIASHPRSQVLFCPASISLQTLWPFFKSWMARLVNSLQRCNGAYLSGRFWKLNSKTEFSLGSKFKPIPATSINIIKVWQFRVPLLYHEDHALLPFMWLKELFMMLKYFLLSNRVLWLNLPTRAPTQLRLSEYTVIITIWWMWFFFDIKIALSRPAHPGNVQQQFNIEQWGHSRLTFQKPVSQVCQVSPARQVSQRVQWESSYCSRYTLSSKFEWSCRDKSI